MNSKDKPAPYSVEQTDEVGKAIHEIGKLALEKADNNPEKAQYLLELTTFMHRKIMNDKEIDYKGLEKPTKTKKK